ncbi:type VI secretion system lipoprotein TssJ [Microbulbifer agarilyticus]
MKSNKLISILIILVVSLAVSACQTTRRTLNFDTSVALQLDVEQSVNPDSDGRASPVVVRVFMLADDRQFSREEFLNLYENAESRLGKDLIDTVILKEFAPGERRTEELPLSPEVKYIGLLAEFVQYRQAEALVLLPITDHRKNDYSVILSGTRMAPSEVGQFRNRARSVREARSKKEDKSITISSTEYERLRAQSAKKQ